MAVVQSRLQRSVYHVPVHHLLVDLRKRTSHMTLDLMAWSDNGKLDEEQLTISSYNQLDFALLGTQVVYTGTVSL